MTTYDLSHRLERGIPVYPDDPPVELHQYALLEEDGYRATELRLSTHAGTHVDAPAHTEPDGRAIDAYPPEAFRFDAVVLDVEDKAPRERITRADLRDAATGVGPAETFGADLFVLKTGWDEYWGREWYLEHPFLGPDAAAWLADNGYHVGVDALSVDPTPTANRRPDEPDGVPAHRALLGADRFVVENLTGLDVAPREFTLEAYPLPVAGGDGAPARVVGRDE